MTEQNKIIDNYRDRVNGFIMIDSHKRIVSDI